MRFSLRPALRVDNVLQLTPALLRGRGVALLLLDLDNTLAPYSGSAPSPALLRWREAMLAGGVGLFLVSNTKTQRAERFAAAWDVPWVNAAKKPRGDGIRRALAQTGRTAGETALAGDQIFTDVLGANLAGLLSILVEPLELKNPFYILRYGLEAPFRFSRRKEVR